MQAGRLDKRVTFRRRPKVTGKPDERKSYVDLFTVAAEFRSLSGRAMAEAGSLTDAIEGTLVVRDTVRTRGLTVADRAVIDGRDFALASVPPTDRSGWLFIKVAQTKGSA